MVGAAATVRSFEEGLKVKEAARKKAVKEAREAAAAADRKRREEQSEEEALADEFAELKPKVVVVMTRPRAVSYSQLY